MLARQPSVPVIDISGIARAGGRDEVASAIDRACRDTGFFCVVGHGIDPTLLPRMDAAAREFFALPEAVKARIAMSVGGSAWRGWFPLGGEVTNGVPDRKEGLYFGEELGPDDARVAARLPLHGANLFPAEVPALGPAVLEWMAALMLLGHALMSAIAVGLGLDPEWFRRHLTADPTVLFRIFRYPDAGVATVAGTGEWGVAEHTDYGLLTMLAQDDRGGLQVESRDGWVDVAPIEDSFVCNIGDMLERMTGGRYRSTPHRVRNTSGRDRLSFPFFFDPSWNARIEPLPLADEPVEHRRRWDGASVFDFDGTYGEYLVAKVSRVFPDLVHVI
ncbi:MAG: 2OG-Fe(II) oxygenase family oxidoreductase [Ilumatobacteraceae bacterium]|nr:2OG-Fe(II) oxygenase family oxidoreductase [Ilumatobacteraceae bacterium]